MSRCARVLIVEDAVALAETYRSYLVKDGFDVDIAFTGAEAFAKIEANPPSVLILDVNLPDMSGLDIMRQARSRNLGAATIVMTAQASVQLAVQAMREGAFDFVMKPFNGERLRQTTRNALDSLEHGAKTPAASAGATGFAGFIGTSPAMQAVYGTLRHAASSNATVFITGESGTGKELYAEALHDLSRRSHGPFIAVNCAAIPRDILESELFGHVKGAFTGATADRKGAVLSADGGTLFLDEICEIDLGLQAKLLRFLQERNVQRVGEDFTRPADIRVICATNRDPLSAVASGLFREDLFYRLHVVPLELPPLRERGDDVVQIARHYLQQFAREDGKTFEGFSAEAERALCAYSWPGNVRQLQNVVRNIVVMHDGSRVELSMLPRDVMKAPPPVTVLPVQSPVMSAASMAAPGALSAEIVTLNSDQPAPAANPAGAAIEPLETVIRRTIEAAVARFNGSIPRAAAALEVAPSTLYRRMQVWETEDAARLAVNGQ